MTTWTPLDVFWMMVSYGSQNQLARRIGVTRQTIIRWGHENPTMRFALDAGRYVYRSRTFPHGTRTGYNQGCRCDDCKRACSNYARESVADRKQHAWDAPHGTRGGYCNWGCRCDPCKAAHSEYMKAYQASRKAAG